MAHGGSNGWTRWPARLVVLVVALAVGALAIACSSPTGSSPTGQQAEPGQRPRTGGPDTDGSDTNDRGGTPTPLDPAGGLLLGTPVYDGDFADPYVLADGGNRYYAYATNSKDANLPVIVSDGGTEGRYHGDAFPKLPSWTTPGLVWAPAVYATGGRYVLYYTTVVNSAKRQCVSRAVADSPLGPFVDDSTAPMVCQLDLGGTIDPSVVTDVDGSSWLLFKNDGNCCKQTTTLWSAPLSPDGLSVVGPPNPLLKADQPWEGNLIEAPSMIIDGGTYYLFYSANAWDTANYAVGYGTCQSIRGPCQKPTNGPWMTSADFAAGPGGQEFYEAAGQIWMVYHGWERGQVGYPQGGERRLYLDVVRLADGRPERLGADRRTFVLWLVGIAAALLVGFVVAVVLVVRRLRRRSRTDTDHVATT